MKARGREESPTNECASTHSYTNAARKERWRRVSRSDISPSKLIRRTNESSIVRISLILCVFFLLLLHARFFFFITLLFYFYTPHPLLILSLTLSYFSLPARAVQSLSPTILISHNPSPLSSSTYIHTFLAICVNARKHSYKPILEVQKVTVFGCCSCL